MSPHSAGRFRLRPEIGVGGSVGQPSEVDEKRIRNLEEDFQSELSTLNQYGNARNLSVMSKVNRKVQGLAAIESTFSFEDSRTGRIWFYKEILVHAVDDSTAYHLSLRCSTDDAATLVPLFDAVCRTFRILGPRA